MNHNFDPAIGKKTRWKKGTPSPNPGGRPKKAVLSEALRAVLAEPFPGDKHGRTYAETIARRLATEAAKGNLRAAAEIADRTEGRARSEDSLRPKDLPLPQLDPKQSPDERIMALTEQLRERIALRRSLALQDSPTPANEDRT